MNLIVFCSYRERDRLYRTFFALFNGKGIVILATAQTLEEDIKTFERATSPTVIIIMKSLLQTGFRIISETPTEVLFSADFPGGVERVQALGRLR